MGHQLWDDGYALVLDMVGDAPVEWNATAAAMIGRMLLVRAVLPLLCHGDHEYDVACRYAEGVRMAVDDAVREYTRHIPPNVSWGTAS